jgi:hypothetical protein
MHYNVLSCHLLAGLVDEEHGITIIQSLRWKKRREGTLHIEKEDSKGKAKS